MRSLPPFCLGPALLGGVLLGPPQHRWGGKTHLLIEMACSIPSPLRPHKHFAERFLSRYVHTYKSLFLGVGDAVFPQLPPVSKGGGFGPAGGHFARALGSFKQNGGFGVGPKHCTLFLQNTCIVLWSIPHTHVHKTPPEVPPLPRCDDGAW